MGTEGPHMVLNFHLGQKPRDKPIRAFQEVHLHLPSAATQSCPGHHYPDPPARHCPLLALSSDPHANPSLHHVPQVPQTQTSQRTHPTLLPSTACLPSLSGESLPTEGVVTDPVSLLSGYLRTWEGQETGVRRPGSKSCHWAADPLTLGFL